MNATVGRTPQILKRMDENMNTGLMEKEVNLGVQIVKDLIAKGCSKWRIMREIQRLENNPRFSYNSVVDWEFGKYCDPKHFKHLQELRYRFYIEHGLNPFKD